MNTVQNSIFAIGLEKWEGIKAPIDFTNGDTFLKAAKPFHIYRKNPTVLVAYGKRRSQYTWMKYNDRSYQYYDYNKRKYVTVTDAEYQKYKANPHNSDHSYACPIWTPKAGFTDDDIKEKCYKMTPVCTGLWFLWVNAFPIVTPTSTHFEYRKQNFCADSVYLLPRKNSFSWGEYHTISASVFFKDEEDFIQWFGEPNHNEMMGSLLTQ